MDGLQLENISHSFVGNRVVDSVDLRVETGDVVCLLGPSGCGKTTTLRIAAGLETLQAGRVVIDGREVARSGWQLPPEARAIGMVFQDYALFPHLTVMENIVFGVRELPSVERRKVALNLLQRLNMGRFAEAYPHTLSGGEQQRVALARALAPKPRVMLLDEPFASLDVRLRDAVRDDTLAVLKDAGTATLLVTHDPEEAMRMADRVAVMRDGRIVQEGSPDVIYSAPVDRFVAEFFGELNVIPCQAGGDDCVSTPLGKVPLAGHNSGANFEVVARLEAIKINGLSDGAPAHVVASRSLGAFGLVEIRLTADGTLLRSRVDHASIPAPGSNVSVTLEPYGAFVFPTDET